MKQTKRVLLALASLATAAVLPMLMGCDGGITVRGRIYGANGAALDNVTATLLSESGDRKIRQENSDPAGCFVFRATVAPGRNAYRVLAEPPGYKPISAIVFSGHKVNEVEMRVVDVDALTASTSTVTERPLAPNEASYFDVRCAGSAGRP